MPHRALIAYAQGSPNVECLVGADVRWALPSQSSQMQWQAVIATASSQARVPLNLSTESADSTQELSRPHSLALLREDPHLRCGSSRSRVKIHHFAVEIILSDLVAELRIRRAHRPIKKCADVPAGNLVGSHRDSMLSEVRLVDEQIVATIDA